MKCDFCNHEFPESELVAETTDTKEPYFHIPLDRAGYDISLIAKWDYLDEVAPEYCGVIEEVEE